MPLRLTCGRCKNSIVENDTYFHCELCHDGSFDICQSCFDGGKACHVSQHHLLHLALQEEISVDLATLKAYYRRCRSHPKYLSLEWENKGKSPEHIDGQFPLPLHEYESLPGRSSIRLLKIEAGSEDDILHYTLHHELLDSTHRPEYVALSYVWGDTRDMVLSVCNGKRLNIHKSLHTALRRLRPKESEDRFQLWADAICINQNDDKEKSIQVAKMWQIYQGAKQTVVWLGDAEEDTSLALEVIHGKLMRSGIAVDNGEIGEVAERHAPRKLQLDLNETLALVRFFNTPWFTRVWVVQEVCLWTKSPPWIVCGPFGICFASIMNAHKLLCQVSVMLPIGPEDPFFAGKKVSMDSPLPRMIQTIRQFYGPSSVSGSHGPSIHQCLADAWELKCTDPRDKVYGLLSLVRNKYIILDQTEDDDDAQDHMVSAGRQQVIKIDYEAEYQTLYEDIARLILDEEGLLGLLTDAGLGHSQNTLLPSWVPDWSYADRTPTLQHWHGETNSTSAYRAAGRTRALVENRVIPGCLPVGAKFQGTVLLCALKYIGEEDIELELPGMTSTPKLKNHIASLWKCFASKLLFYRDNEVRLNAFWRTLICNRRHDLHMGPVPSKSFVESFVLAMIEMLTAPKDTEYECLCPLEHVDSQHSKEAQEVAKVNESAIQINWTAPKSSADYASGSAENDRPSDLSYAKMRASYETGNSNSSDEYHSIYSDHYFDAVRKSSLGRRFFLTHNGYMGVGPRNMEMGDQVVILKGGPLPFILRRDRSPENADLANEECFTLIGEAYVHGLSDGEGIRDMKNPDEDAEWHRILLT